MENERKLHFAGGKKFAHNFHASEKDIVNDEEWLETFGHSSVEIGFEVFALAVDDPLAENLFDRPVTAIFSHNVSGLYIGEDVEKFREWVVTLAPAVINEIEGNLSLLSGNFVQRHDASRVHDR